MDIASWSDGDVKGLAGEIARPGEEDGALASVSARRKAYTAKLGRRPLRHAVFS